MRLDDIIHDIIMDSARQTSNLTEPIKLTYTLREAGIETEPEIDTFKKLMFRGYGAASANRSIELGDEPFEVVVLRLENDLTLDPETSFGSLLETTVEIFQPERKPTITIAEKGTTPFDEWSRSSRREPMDVADASPASSLAGDTTKGGDRN